MPRGADMSKPETVTTALNKLVKDVEALYKDTERQYIAAKKLKNERDEVGKFGAILSEK